MGENTRKFGSDSSDFTDRVDSDAFGTKTKAVYEWLTARVIGQDRAARYVARGLSIHYAGLKDPVKPIGAYFFAGPTGWGKTFMAEELARHLIADLSKAPLTRIPCGKYSEKHRISELIGSPPGYIGSDKRPVLDQWGIDWPHFSHKAAPVLHEELRKPAKERRDVFELYDELGPYTSVILFDEVEKASKKLHDTLLHIIDDGNLSLPHDNSTSFANSVIILTSNTGAQEQQQLLSGKRRGIGFSNASEESTADTEALDQEIYRRTIAEIERRFKPELVGRLKENIVVFRTLNRAQCAAVLETMLPAVQKRLIKQDAVPILLSYEPAFKEFLLDKGVNRKYGLRPLKATLHQYVLLPLANAIENGGLIAGDEVMFKIVGKDPALCRKPRPIAMFTGPVGPFDLPYDDGNSDDDEPPDTLRDPTPPPRRGKPRR